MSDNVFELSTVQLLISLLPFLIITLPPLLKILNGTFVELRDRNGVLVATLKRLEEFAAKRKQGEADETDRLIEIEVIAAESTIESIRVSESQLAPLQNSIQTTGLLGTVWSMAIGLISVGMGSGQSGGWEMISKLFWAAGLAMATTLIATIINLVISHMWMFLYQTPALNMENRLLELRRKWLQDKVPAVRTAGKGA